MSYRFCTLGKYQQRLNYKARINPISQQNGNKVIIEKNKLELFKNRLSIHDTKTLFEKMDIKSKIYIISVLSSLTGEEQTTTEPLEKQPPYKLSPHPGYDKSILRHLLNKNVLLIGCDTDQNAISIHGDNQLMVDIGKCKFELSSPVIYLQAVVFITQLYCKENLDSVSKSVGFAEICKEIQAYECLAFFYKLWSDCKIHPIRSESKFLDLLKRSLKTFSVGQVYNIIWHGIRDAHAYNRVSMLSRDQAVIFSMKCMERNVEKCLDYRWEITPFQRDKNIPQSKISNIVFNQMLGDSDGGYTKPLHKLLKMGDQVSKRD